MGIVNAILYLKKVITNSDSKTIYKAYLQNMPNCFVGLVLVKRSPRLKEIHTKKLFFFTGRTTAQQKPLYSSKKEMDGKLKV